MSRPSPQITTKSINLACFLSMHHGLLVKVEVRKTGIRSDRMQLTFTNPFIRKIRKLYEPDIRITPGTSTGQIRIRHILTGKYQWTPMHEWQSAVNAYQNGTATASQLDLLSRGHWPAN